MKFLKRSQQTQPKISLILIDWSVRESFHLLHYLKAQTIPRDQFEVIIVEYYALYSPAVKQFESMVDTWVLLEMPTDCYYHKHLLYNVGICVAKGEFVFIGDSDAMVKPSFLSSILKVFEDNQHIVLHIDEFRNNRKDLYPFCYPSFEEVVGPGCINYKNGVTTGLLDQVDPLHSRNYGSGFCARRSDLINIGGADEHIDYVGHICGPYEMTFRLMNMGLPVLWHESEFLYHTWHPGQAGQDNYLGPHDGRHMSTTALEVLVTRQSQPHVMNNAMVLLQQEPSITEETLLNNLINSCYYTITKSDFLCSHFARGWANTHYCAFLRNGFLIIKLQEQYVAIHFYIYIETNVSRMALEDWVKAYKASVLPTMMHAKTLSDLFEKIDTRLIKIGVKWKVAIGVTYISLYMMQLSERLFKYCNRKIRRVSHQTKRAFKLDPLILFAKRSRAYILKIAQSMKIYSEQLRGLKKIIFLIRYVRYHDKKAIKIFFFSHTSQDYLLRRLLMAIIRWKQVAVVLCDNATILRALCQSIEADSSNKNAILFLIDKNFYIQHMQQLMCLDHRIKCVVF